jgi:magnesium transporter
MQFFSDRSKQTPGTAPGIEHEEISMLPGSEGRVTISCVDYATDQVLFQEINNLDEFIGQHRPEWTAVRWINVDGLSDTHAIQVLATKYHLHPLAVEDMLQKKERPIKVLLMG